MVKISSTSNQVQVEVISDTEPPETFSFSLTSSPQNFKSIIDDVEVQLPYNNSFVPNTQIKIKIVSPQTISDIKYVFYCWSDMSKLTERIFTLDADYTLNLIYRRYVPGEDDDWWKNIPWYYWAAGGVVAVGLVVVLLAPRGERPIIVMK